MSESEAIEYSIKKECQDVKAVQESTGATYIFGHSYGRFVTLEAARTNPSLTKIAVIESVDSIGHSISTDWMP